MGAAFYKALKGLHYTNNAIAAIKKAFVPTNAKKTGQFFSGGGAGKPPANKKPQETVPAVFDYKREKR